MERYKSRVNDIHKRTKWKTQNYQIWLSNFTTKTAFLDVMLYKDENNNTQSTTYRKFTDQQPFLHAKSEHPRSLKSSILYSQPLRLKHVAKTFWRVHLHNDTVTNGLTKLSCQHSGSVLNSKRKRKKGELSFYFFVYFVIKIHILHEE